MVWKDPFVNHVVAFSGPGMLQSKRMNKQESGHAQGSPCEVNRTNCTAERPTQFSPPSAIPVPVREVDGALRAREILSRKGWLGERRAALRCGGP